MIGPICIRSAIDPQTTLAFVRQTSTCAILLISLLEDMIRTGSQHSRWILMAAYEGSEMSAVAAIHKLNGHCFIHGIHSQAIQQLARQADHNHSLLRLSGEHDTIRAVAELPGLAARVIRDECEHFMVLRAFEQKVEPDGNYRPAQMSDIPALRAYAAGYSAEHNVPFHRDWNQVVAQGQAMIAESHDLNQARQVAACLMLGAVVDPFVLCSGVYTFPSFRGQGYATRLVANFCFEASLAQLDTCLYVGVHNRPALLAYTRVGFTPVDLHRTMYLRPVQGAIR